MLAERSPMLEDLALGQAAQEAIARSRMVGTQAFTAELARLADGET